MNQEQLEKLARWEIKEPNRQELDKFKRKYLQEKVTSIMLKDAVRIMGELESYIQELEYRLGHLEKMPKEEYIKFMQDLDERKQTLKIKDRLIEREKYIERLQKENKQMLDKIFKLEYKLSLYKKPDEAQV